MRQARFPTVTEDSIAALIDAFYAQVRLHPALGPVFEATIADGEWPRHLEKMRRFWSSVMLATGRYCGNPVAVHRAVMGLERPLFADWLALFTRTTREMFAPEAAAAFATKVQRIAGSLQLAIFHRLDGPPEGLANRTIA